MFIYEVDILYASFVSRVNNYYLGQADVRINACKWEEPLIWNSMWSA